MERLAEAIALISSVRQVNVANANACVGLMKEFLRREAIWANDLGLTNEIPFVDLSAGVEGAASLEEEYQGILGTFTYSEAEYRCCLAMLNWYGLQRKIPRTPTPARLADPYLPLLHFFRAGGIFSREHRVFIDINYSSPINSDTIQKGDLTTAFVALDG